MANVDYLYCSDHTQTRTIKEPMETFLTLMLRIIGLTYMVGRNNNLLNIKKKQRLWETSVNLGRGGLLSTVQD